LCSFAFHLTEQQQQQHHHHHQYHYHHHQQQQQHPNRYYHDHLPSLVPHPDDFIQRAMHEGIQAMQDHWLEDQQRRAVLQRVEDRLNAKESHRQQVMSSERFQEQAHRMLASAQGNLAAKAAKARMKARKAEERVRTWPLIFCGCCCCAFHFCVSDATTKTTNRALLHACQCRGGHCSHYYLRIIIHAALARNARTTTFAHFRTPDTHT
jgi:hypothetical protein